MISACIWRLFILNPGTIGTAPAVTGRWMSRLSPSPPLSARRRRGGQDRRRFPDSPRARSRSRGLHGPARRPQRGDARYTEVPADELAGVEPGAGRLAQDAIRAGTVEQGYFQYRGALNKGAPTVLAASACTSRCVTPSWPSSRAGRPCSRGEARSRWKTAASVCACRRADSRQPRA